MPSLSHPLPFPHQMALSASLPQLQPSSLRKQTAVSRSWILLDHHGKATVLDADKHAIMRLVKIHARDLRILDPLLSYPSTILGRDKVIVLNLEANTFFPSLLFFCFLILFHQLILFFSAAH